MASALFSGPIGVAVDSGGNIFVLDGANQVIREITTSGNVSTFAGTVGVPASSDGAATVARFYNPTGIAIDGSGNLYVADQYNSTIRKVTAGGAVSTLAGGVQQYSSKHQLNQ